MTTDPRLTILVQIEGAIPALRDLGLTRVVPTHCAGDPAKAPFRRAYGPHFFEWRSGPSDHPVKPESLREHPRAPGVFGPAVPRRENPAVPGCANRSGPPIHARRPPWARWDRPGRGLAGPGSPDVADGNEGDPSSRTYMARKPRCPSTGIAAISARRIRLSVAIMRRGLPLGNGVSAAFYTPDSGG